MLQIDMTANVRTTFGKGAARTLRSAGQTPAVLYGPKTEAMALECNTKDLTRGLLSINRKNAVINLEVDGTTRQVMTKEIQTDPIQDTIVHADFYEISLEAPMMFMVPVTFVGKAKGVDEGGEMSVAKSKVALKGKALDVPDSVEIDVTSLVLGDAVTAKEIALPAGVTMEENGDAVCVSVVGASAAEEEE